MGQEDRGYLAISALGPDRLGLVAQITDFITQRGGNVEDSRLAILGAEFGGAVLVSGPRAALSAIAREAPGLEAATGLSLLVRPTSSPEEHRRATVVPCVITAQALDQEGIVRSIAGALHRAGINIVTLATTAYNAPVTGSPLFRLEAHVDVPRGVSVAEVRRSMEEVGRAFDLDIEVQLS